MALIVWLPLNGDKENKGLSNYKFTNYKAVVDDNGKIGKCYSFVRSDASKLCTTGFNLKGPYTIALWFNPTDITSTTQWIYCLNKTQGTSSQIPMGAYLTTSGLFIDCGGQKNYQPTITAGNWYHLAVSFDENKVVRTYLNGTLLGSWEGTIPSGDTPNLTFGARSNNESGTSHTYFFNGKMNDIRIYNEALSAKEIKEISKGLIAHYKFDGPKANKNLLKGTNQGLNGIRYSVGARYSRTTEEIMWKGVRACRFGITDGDTSSSSNWRVILFKIENFVSNNIIKPSTSYIVSFDTDNNKITSCMFAASNSGHNLCPSGTLNYETLADGTYHYRISITTYASSNTNWNYDDQELYMGYSLPVGEFGTIANLKVEEGTINTRWIPNEADQLYADLGYDKSFAMDCSGYGYNGTQSGDLVYSADSPRYSGSTIFTNGCLENIPSCLNSSLDAFTIATWFYPTSSETMCIYNNRLVSGQGISVFQIAGKQIRFDTQQQYTPNTTTTTNAWNHVVCVYDTNNTIKQVYLNGELVGSTSTLGNLDKVATKASIGRSSTGGSTATGGNQLLGKLSDFRIYATALSAEDILTLYKNSAIIDNKGNAFAYEFVEEGVE